jgi:membrane protein implicated in regulation of membrane protease activity
MNDWMIWMILAGIVVMLEMFSGTFYLLMVAIGMLCGSAAAFAGVGAEWQTMIAAVVGVIATVWLHNSKYGWTRRDKQATRDPNVNLDIGQTIQVHSWHDQGNGRYAARAMYRGAQWDVELQQGGAEGGMFVIDEVVGSKLMVKALRPT